MERPRFSDARGNHPNLYDCQHTDKAETQHGACFGMHTSKKEGDYASTEPEGHDAHRRNEALPHHKAR